MVRVHKSRDIISCSKLIKHKNLPPAAYIIAVIPVYHSLNRDQALADRSFNESTESVPAAGANSRTKRDFLSWLVLCCKVGRCGLRKMVFFEIFVSRLWILIWFAFPMAAVDGRRGDRFQSVNLWLLNGVVYLTLSIPSFLLNIFLRKSHNTTKKLVSCKFRYLLGSSFKNMEAKDLSFVLVL